MHAKFYTDPTAFAASDEKECTFTGENWSPVPIGTLLKAGGSTYLIRMMCETAGGPPGTYSLLPYWEVLIEKVTLLGTEAQRADAPLGTEGKFVIAELALSAGTDFDALVGWMTRQGFQAVCFLNYKDLSLRWSQTDGFTVYCPDETKRNLSLVEVTRLIESVYIPEWTCS